MRLRDLSTATAAADPRRWLALTRTLDYRRRLDEANAALDLWLTHCKQPAISCSGGKDSTVLLHLARLRDPGLLVVRADPPNPLPDRDQHVQRLQEWASGPWEVVSYPWDVEAVLNGQERYPERLKLMRLQTWARAAKVDGIALGIRSAESKQRRITLSRGLVYPTLAGIRCAPLGRWSAEMVLGHILRHELPLNPVYTRLRGLPSHSMEHLRDGTWWPHGDDAQTQAMRPWLALHYPEIVGQYDRALMVDRGRVEEE